MVPGRYPKYKLEDPPLYAFVINCGGPKVSEGQNLDGCIDNSVGRSPAPEAEVEDTACGSGIPGCIDCVSVNLADEQDEDLIQWMREPSKILKRETVLQKRYDAMRSRDRLEISRSCRVEDSLYSRCEQLAAGKRYDQCQ